MTPVANFATSFVSVFDTGVNDSGGNLPLVSTTIVAKQWEQLSDC
jgi:hypothetical protein